VSNGLCFAFGNWKMKKWKRFVNIVVPWPMPVRWSLSNLERCGAFIAAFTSEKLKTTTKNIYSAIGN
jgi:hypothetical protein